MILKNFERTVMNVRGLQTYYNLSFWNHFQSLRLNIDLLKILKIYSIFTVKLFEET